MAGREIRHEAGNTDELISLEHCTRCEEIILKKLHQIFIRFINPHNVIHCFWRYDIGVLVTRDIQFVVAETDSHGLIAGAIKLLELLPRYKNWLWCLIQVLRDKDVKQQHVADKILEIIEEVKSELHVDPAMNISPVKDVDSIMKTLAEKEALIEKLRTDLEKQTQEQRYLAEKGTGDQKTLLQKLKAEQVRVTADISKMESEMLHFAECGKYKDMENLIRRGIDINIADGMGRTPLMFAARAGNLEYVNWILGQGADLSKTDNNGYTALSLAVTYGRFDCVQSLLDAGCPKQVNISNIDGQTPVMLAVRCKKDNVLCLQKLLKAGADTEMKDSFGYTALAHAADCGNVNCVQTLLEAGGNKNVNVSDAFGQTPLMLAAGFNGDNILCLQKLLNAGSDTAIRDWQNKTALVYANEYRNVRCRQALS